MPQNIRLTSRLTCKHFGERQITIIATLYSFAICILPRNWSHTTCVQDVTFLVIPYRYPVILLHFHLNPGTGGDGFYKGGDGVIRELMFRRKQVLSVLCERRSAFQPYGLQGKEKGSISVSGKLPTYPSPNSTTVN